MVSNKVGGLILGAGALGLLYLGSQGSAEGENAFFGGSGGGGGFFGGQDEGDFTTVQDQPTDSPVNDLINAFLSPSPAPETSSSDYVPSGSTKKATKTYESPTGLKIFTDDSGQIVGSEDPSRMASFNAVGTKKNLNSDLSTGNVPVFQGPVRPSDNETIFRLTGASTGGSSNRVSTPTSSSSSSKKSLKTDSLSGSDKGKGSYTVKKADGSSSKRYFQ